MVSLLYSPYSPDLAPAKFHPFPKRKGQLKGYYFNTVVKIHCELHKVLNLLMENISRLDSKSGKNAEISVLLHKVTILKKMMSNISK